MATKVTARRMHARSQDTGRKRAGRVGVRARAVGAPLEGMIAWRVNDVNGVPSVIYTLNDVKPTPDASLATVQ